MEPGVDFGIASLTEFEIAALSVNDRLALIDKIYGSFRSAPETMSPPDWHRQMLDEVLDEDERNPQPTVSWEELCADLVQFLPPMRSGVLRFCSASLSDWTIPDGSSFYRRPARQKALALR